MILRHASSLFPSSIAIIVVVFPLQGTLDLALGLLRSTFSLALQLGCLPLSLAAKLLC